MTRDELQELMSQRPTYSILTWLGDWFSPVATYYMGKQIVECDDGSIILFEACEWCGTYMSLDENDRCSKCGGYPTAKYHFKELNQL